MQFSLLFFASSATAGPGRDRYRLFLESARYADQNDFTAIWIPERHFHSFGGIYPNPSVLASALAMTTERIRLRAGSVVLPLQNTLRVAEEWSVVDNLSNGRVDLAFATGWNINDFVLAPANYSKRQQVLFAELERLKDLWHGKTITVTNGGGEPRETRTYPDPVQADFTPWITCTGGPQRFMEAGAIGANVLTALLFQSIDELGEKLAAYRQARADNGHDPATGHVTLMLHSYVGESVERVREIVRAPFTEYLRTSADLWRQDSPRLDKLWREKREMLMRYAFDRYFRTIALFGSPESCVPMAQRLWEVGVDEIATLIDFGVEDDLVLDGLTYMKQLQENCRSFASTVERIGVAEGATAGKRKQKIVKFDTANGVGAAEAASDTASTAS